MCALRREVILWRPVDMCECQMLKAAVVVRGTRRPSVRVPLARGTRLHHGVGVCPESRGVCRISVTLSGAGIVLISVRMRLALVWKQRRDGVGDGFWRGVLGVQLERGSGFDAGVRVAELVGSLGQA